MSRLDQSTRLHMDSWTLHAERSTDNGYVAATIDLTQKIGNHEGKLVTEGKWKSTEQWRRWASKELQGTVLRANLRIGDLSWGIRGTWVIDEIDLNEHVYWAGTELKFGQISTEEEDEYNDIRQLSAKDLINVRNGVLSATFENRVQTIDLNLKLGNSNGKFDIGGVRFSMSTKDCTVNGTTLSGRLCKIDRSWVQDEVDLARLVRWRNGALEFSTNRTTTQPTVPLKCNYCRQLFRHGRFFLPIGAAPIRLKPPFGDASCPMCLLLRLIVRDEGIQEDLLTEIVLTPSLYKSHRQAMVELLYSVQSSAKEPLPRTSRYVIYNRAVALEKSSKTFHGIPPNPLLDSWFETDRRWSRIHAWITNCSGSHTGDCQKETWSPLPARVLDLAAAKQGVVRLVTTSGECERYACASYRWGVKAPITLTKANTEEFQSRGVNLDLVPKTLIDVIEVCIKLGLRYLWIDSLCIQQDSESDWQVESLKMASYYGSCFVCIAATSAPHAQAGWQIHPRSSGVKLTGSGPDGLPFRLLAYPWKDIEAFDQYKHFTQLSETDLASSFQILKRGWVYQERRLAPRVLHLCEREVVFECATDTVCECGHCKSYQMNWTKSMPEPPLRLYHYANPTPEPEGQKERDLGNTWRSACAVYSTLDLTFSRDKLPAISGLAKSLQRTGRYLAGLWEDRLLADICWYVGPELVLDDPRITQQNTIREGERRLAMRGRPGSYIAPSWSWANVEEAVSFLHISNAPAPETHVTLLDALMIPKSDDPMGCVTAGSHLKMNGKLIESAWKCDLEAEVNDRWYKLCDVQGMQGQITLYGFLGRSKNNLVAKGDADDIQAEPVRFLPDYGFAMSSSDAISTDEHLYMMPLQTEVAFLHISRLKHEIDRAKVVVGMNGAEYAPSDYSKISALILRRIREHELEEQTSQPVFERVGFTWFFTRKPFAVDLSERKKTDIILV